MNEKSELQVKPVKRYRKPKYPGHDDPDPTLHPQPIPYPASRKFISALAASAGVVMSASCTPPTAPLTDASAPQGKSSDPLVGEAETATPFADEAKAPDPFPGEVATSDPFGDSQTSDPFSDNPFDTLQPQDPFADGGSDTAGADAKDRTSNHESITAFTDEEFAELMQIIEQTVVPDTWEVLGGPATMSPYPGQGGTQPKTAGQAITNAGGNPLCVALSGLPHQTSGFGTGMPNYVQADLARRVIEKVFRGAGYNLRPNQPYDRDGVALVLDGYDPHKKVGFVVVDWNNLDNDALLRWWAPPSKNDGSKYEAEVNTLLQTIASNPKHKSLVADIQAAQKLADPARRSAACKAILEKHRKGLVSLQEMKELEDRAKNKEEYIAVISAYDLRFAHPRYPHLTPAEELEIGKIADPGKRQAATKAALEKKATVAIEALEKAAREYIQWAHREGLN